MSAARIKTMKYAMMFLTLSVLPACSSVPRKPAAADNPAIDLAVFYANLPESSRLPARIYWDHVESTVAGKRVFCFDSSTRQVSEVSPASAYSLKRGAYRIIPVELSCKAIPDQSPVEAIQQIEGRLQGE